VNFRCDDHSLIGKFTIITVTEALPNSLRGELANIATLNEKAI
jgi:hypothetical protein